MSEARSKQNKLRKKTLYVLLGFCFVAKKAVGWGFNEKNAILCRRFGFAERCCSWLGIVFPISVFSLARWKYSFVGH